MHGISRNIKEENAKHIVHLKDEMVKRNQIQLELSEQPNILNELILYRNGRLFNVDADLKSSQPLQFRQVTVVYSGLETAVQLANGISFTLKLNEDRNAFSLLTVVPRRFRSKTAGLLGNMDGNPNNDFVLPDGSPAPIANLNDDEEIYYKFGKLWQTSNKTSLFTYERGQSWLTFVKEERCRCSFRAA
jgi:hypothetical protein